MARSTAVIEGAEVVVETGLGIISLYEVRAGKRNNPVEVKAIDPHLQYPLKAWVDSHDAGLAAAVQAAHDTNMSVAYRIETARLDGQPLDVPMADLPNDAKRRRLVSLSPSGSAPKPQEAPPAPVTAETAPSPTSTATAPNPAKPTPSARREEGRPWERLNTDGTINLGSYAYGASLSCVEWASHLLCDHHRREGMPQPTPGQIAALGRLLVTATDEVQSHLRPDGRHDRMDSSHVRARGAVRSAVEAHPVPWGADADERLKWRGAVVEWAVMLMRVAVDLDG